MRDLNSCVKIWPVRDREVKIVDFDPKLLSKSKNALSHPLRNIISQLSVIFAPVLDYRKCPISAKVGFINCGKVGRDVAGSIPGLTFIFSTAKNAIKKVISQ